jgi:hypothetical protein
MTSLDIACTTMLILITVTQVVLVVRFARICGRETERPEGSTPQPGDQGKACLTPARIVLCLRGSDPFLSDTLRAAAVQDHPDYELRVIVDSERDPAWQQTRDALADVAARCRLIIEPLEGRPTTASLKCASLLQGLDDAETSTAMVALLDADVVPSKAWLRTLAETLAEDQCGVATGNRWYAPPDDSPGSWTRAGWNAGALVQMVCFGIPWGGTLAFRSDLLEAAGLRAKWSTSFCEDTLLPQALRGLGRKVRFVPSLIAVNREHVSLPALFEWVARQLLTARLYHPAWPTVALFGLSAPVAILATAVAVMLAAARGDLPTLGWLLAALGGFLISLPTLFIWIGAIVHQSVGASPRRMPLSSVLWGVLSAQCLYAAALLKAMAMRSAQWRGVTYSIEGPWRIRLVRDSAHLKTASPAASLHSI